MRAAFLSLPIPSPLLADATQLHSHARTDTPAGTAPVMVRVLSTSAGVVRMAAIPPDNAPTMMVSHAAKVAAWSSPFPFSLKNASLSCSYDTMPMT